MGIVTANITSRILLEEQWKQSKNTQEQIEVYTSYVTIRLRMYALQVYIQSIQLYTMASKGLYHLLEYFV